MKNIFSNFTFEKAVWFAPLLYLMHIIEEAAFGFYDFMNRIHGTAVTLRYFLIANCFIMLVYIFLITMFIIWPNSLTVFFLLAGLLAAQFFNAFFHLIMTIMYSEYCPGLITGFVLYVPFNIFLVWMAYQEEYITKTTGAILVVLGATLMTLFEIEGLALIVLIGCPIGALLIVLVYYIKIHRSNL